MAKTTIGINNPSHVDQFPKLPSWLCHPLLMATVGSQKSSPRYWKPWFDQGHQRFPPIRAWHTCSNTCACCLGDNPRTCTILSNCQKYFFWLASLWLKHNHLSIIPPNLHPIILLFEHKQSLLHLTELIRSFENKIIMLQYNLDLLSLQLSQFLQTKGKTTYIIL